MKIKNVLMSFVKKKEMKNESSNIMKERVDIHPKDISQNKITTDTKERENVVEIEQNILEEVERDYKNILDIVEQHGISHFREGIRRVRKQEERREKFIFDITYKYILEENITLKNVFAFNILRSIYREVVVKNLDISYSAAVTTLKGLHFISYKECADKYKSISMQDCKEFVHNNTYYRNKINEHPFDVEQYVEIYSKDILQSSDFLYTHTFEFLCLRSPITGGSREKVKYEDYCTDAMCAYFIEDITKEYNCVDMKNPNTIYDMILNYVRNIKS